MSGKKNVNEGQVMNENRPRTLTVVNTVTTVKLRRTQGKQQPLSSARAPTLRLGQIWCEILRLAGVRTGRGHSEESEWPSMSGQIACREGEGDNDGMCDGGGASRRDEWQQTRADGGWAVRTTARRPVVLGGWARHSPALLGCVMVGLGVTICNGAGKVTAKCFEGQVILCVP